MTFQPTDLSGSTVGYFGKFQARVGMREKVTLLSTPRILLGSGRSGTTWIQDCLADANKLRPIFEPLKPGESSLGRQRAYDVMTRTSRDDALKDLFENPYSGVVANRWVAYRTPRRLVYPKKLSRLLDRDFLKRSAIGWVKYCRAMRKNRHKQHRRDTLIKCIRANLMIDWLVNGLNFTVALVIRHPCAVVESKLRLGKMWDPATVIERYRSNTKLRKLTDGKYDALLAARLSTTEALCLTWVIENQWPVENSEWGGYFVSFYEDFLGESTDEWSKLCRAMRLPNVPTMSQIHKPSQQASFGKKLPSAVDKLAVWQRNLTRQQLDEIQGILDKTNCRLYSVDKISPLGT